MLFFPLLFCVLRARSADFNMLFFLSLFFFACLSARSTDFNVLFFLLLFYVLSARSTDFNVLFFLLLLLCMLSSRSADFSELLVPFFSFFFSFLFCGLPRVRPVPVFALAPAKSQARHDFVGHDPAMYSTWDGPTDIKQ